MYSAWAPIDSLDVYKSKAFTSISWVVFINLLINLSFTPKLEFTAIVNFGDGYFFTWSRKFQKLNDADGSPPVILSSCNSCESSGHHFINASTYGLSLLFLPKGSAQLPSA